MKTALIIIIGIMLAVLVYSCKAPTCVQVNRDFKCR